LRMSTAVVVIASFVAWRPAMMASMTPMSCGEHAGHHHNSPQHQALSLDCCSACVCSCAAVAGVPVTATVAEQQSRAYAPSPTRVEVIALVAPHRLPFSIGPPPHLA
jgi:hypothetical protein